MCSVEARAADAPRLVALNGAGSNTQRSQVDRDSTTEGEVQHQHHGDRQCSEERPGIHEVGRFHGQGRQSHRDRQQCPGQDDEHYQDWRKRSLRYRIYLTLGGGQRCCRRHHSARLWVGVPTPVCHSVHTVLQSVECFGRGQRREFSSRKRWSILVHDCVQVIAQIAVDLVGASFVLDLTRGPRKLLR
jgi:hypothetical protein